MTISFNQIPNLLLTPGVYIEYDNSRAVQGLAVLPNRVLLIGGRLSTGTVATNTLVQILGKGDGDTFFGRGSQLGAMCRKFKENNALVEVWAIGITSAGTAATKTLTVTGPATSAGTIHLLVAGFPVDVAVPSGSTADQIAALIDTALAVYEGDFEYTFATVTNVVTGTARNANAESQAFDIRLNYYEREVMDMPAGVAVAVANGVSGATNPSVANALAAIGEQWFTTIVSGFGDATNIGLIETELSTRWGPTIQQDGMVWYAMDDTHANITTAAGSRNSQFSVLLGFDNAPTTPHEWAAAFAAVSVGEPDPARPRQTLQVKKVLPPTGTDIFTREERNLLLEDGVSTFLVDPAGQVSIERIVTTYKTNALGAPDTSYRNLETMLTIAAIRFTARVKIATKYPRHKLVDDDSNYGAGQAVVTPSVIRGELLAIFKVWEESAWVEDFAQFKDELIVERNASDRDRLDARMGPNLANQFRVMAGQVQFIV